MHVQNNNCIEYSVNEIMKQHYNKIHLLFRINLLCAEEIYCYDRNEAIMLKHASIKETGIIN